MPVLLDLRADVPSQHRWLRDTTAIIEHLEADQRVSRSSEGVPLEPVRL